jgi:signal transduction histidine kinase
MSRRSATVLATFAGVFAVLTTAVGMVSGAPPQFLVADLVMGLTFLVAGVVAVRQRPDSPAGAVLLACTPLWFIGSYAPTFQPVVTHLGFAFERYYDLVLAALLLLLSTGIRGWSRVLLAGLGSAMAARSFGRLVFQDPTLFFPDCEGCPANPFAFYPDLAAFETFETVTNLAIAVFAILIGLIAVLHFRGFGSAARRLRWPIVIAGIIAMAGAAFDAFEYAWTTATDMALVDLGEPGNEVFSWALFGARVVVPVLFLVAVLRERGRTGALGPLAARLEQVPPGTTIGDSVRTALGDPSLALLRPDGSGGWLDEVGASAPLPTGDEGPAVTVVGPTSTPLAALVHDPALNDHPELLDGVVRVLGLALENERLESQLREQLVAVTESRARIVSAAEEERRRLERDLHDGAQQRLIGVTLALQRARATAESADGSAALVEQLDGAASELAAAISELREFARGIHPAILEEDGLEPAVAGLARRSAIPVEVGIDLDGRLPSVVESTVYYTVAEALTNCQRHGNATHAEVRIAHVGERLEVEIRDDGVGGADPARGTGLRGLADRVTAIGGQLLVDSPPAGGTVVRATIPA